MWQSEKAAPPLISAPKRFGIARTRRHPQNGDMKSSKPIQIFKPGKRTAMSGVTLDFSDADLQATAAAYDPAKHEAPLVVGHPKHDDPAYGWAASLAYADGALEAMPVPSRRSAPRSICPTHRTTLCRASTTSVISASSVRKRLR